MNLTHASARKIRRGTVPRTIKVVRRPNRSRRLLALLAEIRKFGT